MKNKTKKIKGFTILIISLLVLALSGCGDEALEEVSEVGESADKPMIVATLFPQYDFAKEIAGDKAQVTMLLPLGTESHAYEPKPSDIVKINDSDLFIYTGEHMEVWAESLLEGIDNPDGIVLDVSKGIKIEYIDHIEDDHSDEDSHEEEASNEHLFDPHIWTDPNNAIIMVNNILDSLCQIDPENAAYYNGRAEAYTEKLKLLDQEFREILENGSRKKVVFASKFALLYFAKQYGLQYEAAFDSCSTETEPSARTVAHLITEIKEDKLPVVYYAEMIEPKVAKSIGEETGAKALLFHSCHNVTTEEFANGASYLSLMAQNGENLREGLK